MTGNNPKKSALSAIGNSVSFKIITIFLLILALLIPSSMIKSLIREREYRKRDVINEISSKWGHAQTITGPIVTIPYKKYYIDSNKNKRSKILHMYFLPDDIDIKSKIFPKMRYRGIYEAVLYNTKVVLTGSFSYPQIEEMNIPTDNVVWSGATVSIGITDMRGIKDEINATFNNDSISMNPGVDTNEVICSGISSKIKVQKNIKKYSYKFVINLNGSQKINFIPVGKLTTVSMSSSWTDPSFDGAYLPVERSIGKKGFSANWKVLHLNRNYPQYWTGNKYSISDSAFGVKLFIPVDIYQKSMRTAKYALMFIIFTFMAFFFSEVMNKLRVHPIQYLLIGLAITIFYTLLISISEHINFNTAYFISSVSVILVIAGYAKSILKNVRLSAMVGGVLLILYTYLYLLLQLEDYALLMGSVGLFVVLSLIMYMTRKIDWYSIKLEDK